MIEYIVNSIFNSITYIIPVGSQKDCYLVDCGDVEKVIKQGWLVRGVLLTHAHFDHIYGLNKLMEMFPDALVYTNADGQKGLQNPKWNFSRYHEEVENFVFCKSENVRVFESCGVYEFDKDIKVEVLFTPGHDLSCITYKISNCLYTGDAYIPGIKVVTTFPRSNKQVAKESLERLQKLECLGLKIMPGHWVEGL